MSIPLTAPEPASGTAPEPAPRGSRAHRRPASGIRRAVPRGRRPRRTPRDTGAHDRVGEVVRWAVFGCALVPLVLLVCGSSPVGAAGAAAGLALVTAVCRFLLRHSERTAARPVAERAGPHRGRHGRTGTGAHRGGRRQR